MRYEAKLNVNLFFGGFPQLFSRVLRLRREGMSWFPLLYKLHQFCFIATCCLMNDSGLIPIFISQVQEFVCYAEIQHSKLIQGWTLKRIEDDIHSLICIHVHILNLGLFNFLNRGLLTSLLNTCKWHFLFILTKWFREPRNSLMT